MKENHVWIRWGAAIEPKQEPSYYEFDSAHEMAAFLYGVDEACGWLESDIAHDGDQCLIFNNYHHQCDLEVGHEGECVFGKTEEE